MKIIDEKDLEIIVVPVAEQEQRRYFYYLIDNLYENKESIKC
jgi:hypothetical protein